MVWQVFLRILPDKQFRVRSAPKLAFSPQVLVIIADLCNATYRYNSLVSNSAHQWSELEPPRRARAECVRYGVVAGHRDPLVRACKVPGSRADRGTEQRGTRIDRQDSGNE